MSDPKQRMPRMSPFGAVTDLWIRAEEAHSVAAKEVGDRKKSIFLMQVNLEIICYKKV